MNTMGIDIGHQHAKAVILGANRIVGHVSLAVAGEVQAAAKIVFDKVLKQAHEKRKHYLLFFLYHPVEGLPHSLICGIFYPIMANIFIFLIIIFHRD